MNIQQQSAVLRAMRAWIKLDQKAVAIAAAVSERTLLKAERGELCSDATWSTMLGYYEHHGLFWRGGTGPGAIVIVAPKNAAATPKSPHAPPQA